MTAILLLAGAAGAQQGARVTVLDPTPGATLLRVELRGHASTPVAGTSMVEISLPGEAYLDVAGEPHLPWICRSVVIPQQEDVVAQVLAARWHEVGNIDLAPGRGPIARTEDPSTVPYARGPTYAQPAFWPAEVVAMREAYIMRDVRGAVLEVVPFQYEPRAHVLRVYDELLVRVSASGPATSNALQPGTVDRREGGFQALFAHHFINWVQSKAISFAESGNMLIISHGPFMSAMQPLVDWKNSKGIQTTIVDVATIGNNSAAIKSYIQGVYNSSNLSYVLLVGDVAQVASGSFAGGLSDPDYSTMTADWYPDLLVGRFSAESVAQVDTQVLRSIEYEQMDHSLAGGSWNGWGMGVASNQGPGHFGEYDFQHMNLIRTDLLNYGFTKVDQIYDPTATKAMVKAGLEEGRRLVDYCGHGSETSWGTTGWSNADIANLHNDNKLPAIHSVACVNGAFAGTCFAEAWLRASQAGEPTGAVGAYMSSINQYWNEPMYAQDETIDLFCAEAYWGMGALWFAGSCKMMDITSSAGRDMFMTWIVFGDPSLRLVSDVGCTSTSNYCNTTANSAGPGAWIGSTGSTNIANNDLTLTVAQAVPGKVGLFFYGGGQTSSPFGNGTLCVSAGGKGTFRLDPVVSISAGGTASFALNFAAPPNAAGQITAGSTWYFQFWYRDPAGGGAGYNLSDALEATFCP